MTAPHCGPHLMTYEQALAICGPDLVAQLEEHAAAAPPLTEEQRRILRAAFAAAAVAAPSERERGAA